MFENYLTFIRAYTVLAIPSSPASLELGGQRYSLALLTYIVSDSVFVVNLSETIHRQNISIVKLRLIIDNTS